MAGIFQSIKNALGTKPDEASEKKKETSLELTEYGAYKLLRRDMRPAGELFIPEDDRHRFKQVDQMYKDFFNFAKTEHLTNYYKGEKYWMHPLSYARLEFSEDYCRSPKDDMMTMNFRNEAFIDNLAGYKPFKIKDLLECFSLTYWPFHPDYLERIALTFPWMRNQISDKEMKGWQERIDFINSRSNPYEKIAALIACFAPFGELNFSYDRYQRTCDEIIKPALHKLLTPEDEKKVMNYVYALFIGELSILQDNNIVPLEFQKSGTNIVNHNECWNEKQLRNLVKFRNDFYKAGIHLMQPKSFIVWVQPDEIIITERDIARVRYEAFCHKYMQGIQASSIKHITSERRSRLENGNIVFNEVPLPESEQYTIGGYMHKSQSFEKSPSGHCIIVSAKNPLDFASKLSTIGEDLIDAGMSFYVADSSCSCDYRLKQNRDGSWDYSQMKRSIFHELDVLYGRGIIIEAATGDARKFFDKHPELLLEDSVAVKDANHIGGSLYGVKFIDNLPTNRKDEPYPTNTGSAVFTLEEFIQECEGLVTEKEYKHVESLYREFYYKTFGNELIVNHKFAKELSEYGNKHLENELFRYETEKIKEEYPDLTSRERLILVKKNLETRNVQDSIDKLEQYKISPKFIELLGNEEYHLLANDYYESLPDEERYMYICAKDAYDDFLKSQEKNPLEPDVPISESFDPEH